MGTLSLVGPKLPQWSSYGSSLSLLLFSWSRNAHIFSFMKEYLVIIDKIAKIFFSVLLCDRLCQSPLGYWYYQQAAEIVSKSFHPSQLFLRRLDLKRAETLTTKALWYPRCSKALVSTRIPTLLGLKQPCNQEGTYNQHTHGPVYLQQASLWINSIYK